MTDRFTVRVVTTGLAVIAFGGLAGVILLAVLEREIPDLLGYVLTTSLGALSALLASTRTADTPAPVSVVNTAEDPVLVEEAPDRRRGPDGRFA